MVIPAPQTNRQEDPARGVFIIPQAESPCQYKFINWEGFQMLKKIDPNIPYYWIKLDTGKATVRGANELDDPAAADQRFLAANYFDDRAMAEWYAEMINLTLQARNYDPDIDDKPDYNTSNVKRVPKGQRYFYLTADDNADLSPVECGVPPTF